MSTDNAYVQADMLGVSTDVAGTCRDRGARQPAGREGRGAVPARRPAVPDRARRRQGAARHGPQPGPDAAGELPNMLAQIEQAKADLPYYSDIQAPAGPGGQELRPAGDRRHARSTISAAQQKLASLDQQQAGIAAKLGGNPDQPVEDNPFYLQAIGGRRQRASAISTTRSCGRRSTASSPTSCAAGGPYLAAAATGVQPRLDRRMSGSRPARRRPS